MTDRPGATYALGLEYDGRAFHGFQRQRNATSVQETLEDALSRVADHSIRVTAAGRTDARVHATQQVVSFDTRASRTPEQFLRAVNSLTPPALSINWCRTVDEGFNARFDAVARRYLYVFYEAGVRPALQHGLVTWTRRALDDEAMHTAAQNFVGEHDFSSFRAAGCQARSPFRRVHRVHVERRGPLIALDIVANAFLLHMVRNMAGALAEVGAGAPPGWIADLLHLRDRNAAPATAAPDGLYLIQVQYPALDVPARLPLIW